MQIDDDSYEEIMDAHRGLSAAQSQRFDAALVLLLAHQVADRRLLRDFLRAARGAVLARENA
jgi:hypothetical protein